MHRIDTATALKDKFGAGKNGFTRGNPQTGTPATDLDDDYFDMLQEELVNVVETASIELDKNKHDQLLQALRKLFLNRSNPFSDINSDGTVSLALANLGLGAGAKLQASNASISTAGYISIPSMVSGIERNIFFQWRTVSMPQSDDGTLQSVEASWPVPFPTQCLTIMQALNNSLIYAISGNPFSSASIVDRSRFKVASSYSKSASSATIWGIGY